MWVRFTRRCPNQESNQINLDVAGIVLENAQGRHFTIPCAKPVRDQELHLLLIDVDPRAKGQSSRDATIELQESAFRALNAKLER